MLGSQGGHKMALRVRGIEKAKRMTAELIGEIQAKKVNRAMYRSLKTVALQSAHYTPEDTGTLVNSQYTETLVRGKRLIGRVGYSANYALFVHDPSVKQTFKKPSARKEFLKLGFEESKEEIDRIIEEEMRL